MQLIEHVKQNAKSYN